MIPYELAFLFGLLGFVYTNVLTEAGMIFSPLYKWLNLSIFKNDKREDYHWLFKIIIHCERCFTGQLALWWYVFRIKPANIDGLMLMLFFIAFSILVAYTLNLIFQLLKKFIL